MPEISVCAQKAAEVKERGEACLVNGESENIEGGNFQKRRIDFYVERR